MDEIPEWAAKKAVDLANATEASLGSCADWKYSDVESYGVLTALARYIAEHEEPPVDPDVLAVRAILAAWLDVDASITNPAVIRNGACDQNADFLAAIAAYREHASKRNG